MTNIDQKKADFTKILLKWHSTLNFREMPWKGEKEPYRIWLSEVILQQTRVDQGWAYYQKFISAFPSINDLANAPEQQVFKLWEGLGYYSRCRNLIATARRIATDHNGCFPSTYDEILALKGVDPTRPPQSLHSHSIFLMPSWMVMLHAYWPDSLGSGQRSIRVSAKSNSRN